VRRCGRTSDLLHVLAWASVLPFTRDSVRSGVFWGWLMAARPLLSEMHDACCWVFEQRRGLFAADEVLRSVNKLGVAASEQRLSAVGKRHSDEDDAAHDETALVERQASGSKAGEATQHVHVEPHRIWLAFLDERHTVWFQSSATHVVTLRRMDDRAFADPALLTTSPSSLAARCLLLRWCACFVDEGAFLVTLMSLPAPRAAVPLGARLVRRAADVARGREPRRGRVVAQQHDGAVCRRARPRPHDTTKRGCVPVDVEHEKWIMMHG
jgi:hypothetical protein